MKTAYRKWIAARLKELRLLKQLSQKQIADLLEIKLRTYQSYEEGRAEPSLLTVKNFCRIIHIKVDHFLINSPETSDTKD